MPTSTQSLLELTLKVVQEAERKVLMFSNTGPVRDAISRNVIFPLPFIKVGFGELFRPFSKWMFGVFALFIAAVFLIPILNITDQEKSYVFLCCVYVPLFLVAFAVPSTFVFDSIKTEHIRELADYIYSLGIDNKDKVNAVEENLTNIAERAYARSTSFQWIVATVWALLLFGLNQFNNFALKVSPEKMPMIISENLTALFTYGPVTILSIIVIVGYKKGNDAIFRRLKFAIQELNYRFAIQ